MTTEVYLQNNEKEGRVEVVNLETNQILYYYSYRDEGINIWDYEDSWRILRHTHLRSDLYKEVFKCEKCKSVLRIPEKVEANIDEVNNISFELSCECGNKTKIKCDTLVIGEKQ